MVTGANSKRPLHLGIAGLVVIAWACQGGTGETDTTGGSEPTYDASALLQSVSDNVMGPAAAEFVAAASALEGATSAYAAAVGGSDEADRLADARGAWEDAMMSWQVLEGLQLGPLGSSSAVGGASVRDEVYSWPTVNPCRVDQELVAGEYGAADFADNRLVNVYGLDAIEYLLFHDGPDNDCAPQIEINEGGDWDAIAGELTQRRADYAAGVADELVAHAQTLESAWGSGGEFATALASPGDDSHYGSQAVALDELVRVMFYLDKMVKDTKLAAAPIESPWATRSKEHVLQNLAAFRMVYYGGDGPDGGSGFDEILETLGEDELASSMGAAIDDAIAAVEAVPGSFSDALAGDAAALDDALAKVKAVTDLLKGDFVTVLTLNVPSEAAGDAD